MKNQGSEEESRQEIIDRLMKMPYSEFKLRKNAMEIAIAKKAEASNSNSSIGVTPERMKDAKLRIEAMKEAIRKHAEKRLKNDQK